MKPKIILIVLAMLLTFSGCTLEINGSPLLLEEPQFEYDPPKIYLQRDITMTFTGDVSFADNWHIMEYATRKNLSPVSLISEDLKYEMANADIAHMNNEFCFSTKGKPVNKAYNFRAAPENVKYYNDLGIDFVTLANNHCFDYGPEAFLEMLDVLNGAEIKYVGAGRNLAEAAAPIYYTIDKKTIAFVAGSRAEKTLKTPEATDKDPGVLYCYDTDKLVAAIKEAKSKADFVVVLVHWGTEDSHKLEPEQKTSARAYVDAGADLIVGGHAHCLQGIEYYKNVPIIYNLGNFLFSNNNVDTALLKVTLSHDGKLTVQLIPAVQKDCNVLSLAGTPDGRKVLDDIESYSEGITIDDNGIVTG
jgi:poly-gamma-glutamate synthesis protein (capsule biosynthesis protein)